MDFDCNTCKKTYDRSRPVAAEFDKYLSFFLEDIPEEQCSKGGRPSYRAGVKYEESTTKGLQVKANYYMAYHTILKTSKDYYEAMRAARKVAANITETINIRTKALGLNSTVEVFPYRYVGFCFVLLLGLKFGDPVNEIESLNCMMRRCVLKLRMFLKKKGNSKKSGFV